MIATTHVHISCADEGTAVTLDLTLEERAGVAKLIAAYDALPEVDSDHWCGPYIRLMDGCLGDAHSVAQACRDRAPLPPVPAIGSRVTARWDRTTGWREGKVISHEEGRMVRVYLDNGLIARVKAENTRPLR